MFSAQALQGGWSAVDSVEFPSRDFGEKSTSELILAVGRIHFLVAVGLMSLFPCWPSPRANLNS